MPHILRYWGLGLHHAELGKHSSTCNTNLLNMPCKAICLLLLTFVALVFTTVYLHDVCPAVSQVNGSEHHLIQIRTHRCRVHGVHCFLASQGEASSVLSGPGHTMGLCPRQGMPLHSADWGQIL